MTTKLKALVVDDEKILREFIREELEDFNVEVTEAGDGKDAFEITKKEAFDVIISDMKMPEWTGHDFLSHFQKDEQCQSFYQDKNGPYIVLISAYHIHKEEELREIGVQEILRKPFNMDGLLETLRKKFPSFSPK